MFLTGKRNTVSAPRATVPKLCSRSANILSTHCSARASWTAPVATQKIAMTKERTRIDQHPPFEFASRAADCDTIQQKRRLKFGNRDLESRFGSIIGLEYDTM